MEPGTSAADKSFHFSPPLLTLQYRSEFSQFLGFVHVTALKEDEMIQPRSKDSTSGTAVPSLPHGQASLTLCWPAWVD